MKSKYKIFGIIIVGIIAVFTSYITLNFRWHLVLRDNKVIEYKAGLVDKNIRNLTVYIPEGTTEIMDDAFSDLFLSSSIITLTSSFQTAFYITDSNSCIK